MENKIDEKEILPVAGFKILKMRIPENKICLE
jgi:hypothetical protein